MEESRKILIATLGLTVLMFLIVNILIAFPRIQLYFCHKELERIDNRCDEIKQQISKIDQLRDRSNRLIKIYKERDRNFRYRRNHKPLSSTVIADETSGNRRNIYH